jgi:hypothetical protein
MKSNLLRRSTLQWVAEGLMLWLAVSRAVAAEPKITISKETTFITQPLRSDGTPDYVAALNHRMSQGVTPDNNAAVLLIKAFGQEDLSDSLHAELCKSLGIEPLPKQGNYFVDATVAIRRWRVAEPQKLRNMTDDQISKQIERASEIPLSENEFPIVAEWLTTNEEALKLVTEATGRTRYFRPVSLVKGSPLMTALKPELQRYRFAADALAARAMLRLQQGQIDDAWSDLLACHRLGNLAAQDDCGHLSGLVSIAIQQKACVADAALVHHARLSARQRLTPRPRRTTPYPRRQSVTVAFLIRDLSTRGG